MVDATGFKLVWWTAACLCFALGCGGASRNVQYAPMTAEQQRVFDHGVDFVAALEGLEGRWREEWDRDLAERAGGADYIGIIGVHSLLTETDPEQRVTHRLVADVQRSLYGDPGKDLELRVTEGQPGFTSVHENLPRIESREFVVYVKWYRDEDGERAAHFHLSPASDVIIRETETAVSLRGTSGSEGPEERVVVHNN